MKHLKLNFLLNYAKEQADLILAQEVTSIKTDISKKDALKFIKKYLDCTFSQDNLKPFNILWLIWQKDLQMECEDLLINSNYFKTMPNKRIEDLFLDCEFIKSFKNFAKYLIDKFDNHMI